MSQRIIWRWAITFALPLFVYAVFPAEAAGTKGVLFMTITVWAVTAWATEILPSIVVGATLTFSYILFSVAGPRVVFAPWTTFLPWIVFASLIIADAMGRSGLGKRIALKGMLMLGSSFTRTMFGMSLAGIFMALLLPAVMARAVLFVTIAQGICQALELNPKSRMSSTFILGGYMAAISPGIMLLTANENNLMGMQMFSQVATAIPWFDFAVHNLFYGILYALVSMACVFMVRGKERLSDEGDLRRVLQARYDEMGPMSAVEYKVLAILVVSVIAFMTEKWHGLPAPYIFCMGSMLCFIPKMGISGEANLKSLNIGFMIFLTACQSIGFVAAESGVSTWLAGMFTPLLHGQGSTMTVVITYTFGVIINFLLTPMAALSTFAGSMADIGMQVGVEPAVMLYSFLYGLDQCIFPYEIGYFLFIFMTGAITLRHIIPAMLARMAFGAIGLALLQVPYWKLIGLLN